MLKLQTVPEAIEEVKKSHPNRPFDINNPNGGVIIGSIFVEQFFRENYSLFSVMGDLYDKWNIYNNMYAQNMAKAYNALNSSYKPIENYNMTEIEATATSDGDEIHERSSSGSSDSSSQNAVDITTTASPNVKTERYITTFEQAANPRLDGYEQESGTRTERTSGSSSGNTSSSNVDSISESTERTTHENVTLSFSGESVTAERAEIKKLTRSGNIGVTTSQQMLQSEIELRRQSVVEDFLTKFAEKYFFFAG